VILRLGPPRDKTAEGQADFHLIAFERARELMRQFHAQCTQDDVALELDELWSQQYNCSLETLRVDLRISKGKHGTVDHAAPERATLNELSRRIFALGGQEIPGWDAMDDAEREEACAITVWNCGRHKISNLEGAAEDAAVAKSGTDAASRVLLAYHAHGGVEWNAKTPEARESAVRHAATANHFQVRLDPVSALISLAKLLGGSAQETLDMSTRFRSYVEAQGGDPAIEIMAFKRGATGTRNLLHNAVAAIHNQDWVVRFLRTVHTAKDGAVNFLVKSVLLQQSSAVVGAGLASFVIMVDRMFLPCDWAFLSNEGREFGPLDTVAYLQDIDRGLEAVSLDGSAMLAADFQMLPSEPLAEKHVETQWRQHGLGASHAGASAGRGSSGGGGRGITVAEAEAARASATQAQSVTQYARAVELAHELAAARVPSLDSEDVLAAHTSVASFLEAEAVAMLAVHRRMSASLLPLEPTEAEKEAVRHVDVTNDAGERTFGLLDRNCKELTSKAKAATAAGLTTAIYNGTFAHDGPFFRLSAPLRRSLLTVSRRKFDEDVHFENKEELEQQAASFQKLLADLEASRKYFPPRCTPLFLRAALDSS
jgi:hypothetical protein